MSDITYIRTQRGFSYLSLITDAYSRKVVGYALYPTLEADEMYASPENGYCQPKQESPYILIHHSDRGVQYCCSDYVSLLEAENIAISKAENIAISMTQTGSPYDNPQAERVNGTIKNEFSPNKIYRDHQEAEKGLLKPLPSTIRSGRMPVWITSPKLGLTKAVGI